jgi:hypothetical protein
MVNATSSAAANCNEIEIATYAVASGRPKKNSSPIEGKINKGEATGVKRGRIDPQIRKSQPSEILNRAEGLLAFRRMARSRCRRLNLSHTQSNFEVNEDNEEQVASSYATVADLFAAAEVLIKKGEATPRRLRSAAFIAARRARLLMA